MAIMISTQPQWVEKILNLIKKSELRKTCPKEWKDYLSGKTKVKPEAEKVYIYCTKSNYEIFNTMYGIEHNGIHTGYLLNGEVVAEFKLNEVTRHLHNFIDAEDEECYNFLTEDVKNAGFKTDLEGLLDFDRFIEDYGKGKPLYAWHIDNLKIYDEPKELVEFKKQNQCYKSGNLEELGCWECGCTCQDLGECDGRYSRLRRPPQSWCYVEEF